MGVQSLQIEPRRRSDETNPNPKGTKQSVVVKRAHSSERPQKNGPFRGTEPRFRFTLTTLQTIFCIVVNTPAVLLTWLQVAFNATMGAYVILGVRQLSRELQADLDKRIQKQQHVLLQEIVTCSREYLRNQCSTLPAPALESPCAQWELCMNQDVNSLLTSKEGAVVFAEILNRFFHELSDRTLLCVATILFGSIVVTNIMFSWSKHKHQNTSFYAR